MNVNLLAIIIGLLAVIGMNSTATSVSKNVPPAGTFAITRHTSSLGASSFTVRVNGAITATFAAIKRKRERKVS